MDGARRADLLEAVKALAPLVELPDGRVDEVAEVQRVFDAADELARRSELEETFEALDGASDGFSAAARSVVLLARMRADDRFILGHGDKGIELLRVDFQGTEAAVPELEAVLRPSADGSLWLRSEHEEEREPTIFAGEFQFVVGGSPETLEGLERQLESLSTSRGRDEYGLNGEMLLSFSLGVGMRAAWGSGVATLTEERLLGVIFDDAIQGRPKGLEDAWMPPAFVASDVSTVIAFEIPRSAIEEVEVIDNGFIGRRIPYANIHGENFSFACQTIRIAESERLVKPKKGVLADALRSLA